MDIASGARPGNEGRRPDQHSIVDTTAPHVRFLGVAEGFGANDRRAPGAPEALTFARDYLRRQSRAGVFSLLGGRPKILQQLLIDALEFANKRLFDRSGSNDDHIAGGIAVVGALIAGRHAVVAHAGDARAYVWRRGTLQAITTDDAVVIEGVPANTAAGGYPAAPVRLLWRSLGTQSRLEAGITVFDLLPDDRLCLCTSGVHRGVSHADLTAAISRAASAADALGGMQHGNGGLSGAAVIAFGTPEDRAEQIVGRLARYMRPTGIALALLGLSIAALLIRTLR